MNLRGIFSKIPHPQVHDADGAGDLALLFVLAAAAAGAVLISLYDVIHGDLLSAHAAKLFGM
ncbi:MAG: hypothetical protein GC185_13455 [Alphaproteobacteria bacterium]|nr:hypothetical protein [Alphaproteobacteria bacterium]